MITVGTVVAAIGFLSLLVALSAEGGHTSAATVVAPMTIVGFGNGLAVPALIGTVLGDVKIKHAGTVSGVLTTSQQLASAAGIAIIGGIFFATLDVRRGNAGYVTSLEWVTTISLFLALATAVVSTRLPGSFFSRRGALAVSAAENSDGAPGSGAAAADLRKVDSKA